MSELPEASWRAEFPAGGPGADAPRAEVERYFILSWGELLRWSRKLAAIAMEGVEEEDGHRAVTFEDVDRFDAYRRDISAQLRLLRGMQEVAGARRRFGADKDADLLALAEEIGRREGFAYGEGAVSQTVDQIGQNGPMPHDSFREKCRWFQAQYQRTREQSRALSRVAAANDAERQMVNVGRRAIEIQSAILRQWAVLVGASVAGTQEERVRLVDLLMEEVLWYQRLRAKIDSRHVQREYLHEWIETAKLARRGDYMAFRLLCGYTVTESTAAQRFPLQHAYCHTTYIKARMADWICKSCGEWHLADLTPKYDQPTDSTNVEPARCSHCGAEDCAGQRNHRICGPRGTGKSEEMKHEIPARIGVASYRGYLPRMALVGCSKEEANKRREQILLVMQRPAYRLIFPAAYPSRRQSEPWIRVRSGTAVLTAYGIESFPAGEHLDHIAGDDIVNERAVFAMPALMDKIRSKLDNVWDYSTKPWTTLSWDTTTWQIGDPDQQVEDYALAHPESWVNCVVACGGPDAVYDEQGNLKQKPFWSPWPQWHSPKSLRLMYEKNPYAYDRNMRMMRVTDEDRFFTKVGLYLTDNDPLLGEAPPEFLSAQEIVSQDELRASDHLLAVDLAFTGKRQRDADPRGKKRRSRTAFIYGRIHAVTRKQYLVWQRQAYLAPSEHEEEIAKACRLQGCYDVAIEADKTVSELIDDLENKRGLRAQMYVPSKLGSKEERKVPVAKMFNEGRVFLPGRLVKAEEWSVVPAEGWAETHRDLLMFPARLPDSVDAIEIFVRVALQIWGGDIEPTRAGEAPCIGPQRTGWRDKVRVFEAASNSDDEMVSVLERLAPDPMEDLGVHSGAGF